VIPATRARDAVLARWAAQPAGVRLCRWPGVPVRAGISC